MDAAFEHPSRIPLLLDKDHPGSVAFVVASWATSVEGRARR